MSDIANMCCNSSRQQSREAGRRTRRTSSLLHTPIWPLHPSLSPICCICICTTDVATRSRVMYSNIQSKYDHVPQPPPPPPPFFTPSFSFSPLPLSLCLGPGFPSSEI
ncbi:hypothetical protein CGRA01v4_08055 [Colletotrichum graminicola]|nr:hypothetical protein CGRA01v4_08055 [Colletotrichum graminicola]